VVLVTLPVKSIIPLKLGYKLHFVLQNLTQNQGVVNRKKICTQFSLTKDKYGMNNNEKELAIAFLHVYGSRRSLF